MTLSCVTWILALVVAVQGQKDANGPPENANFSCRGRPTGFYADIESNCAIYHTCDNHGNKFTYYCPKETKFCQETLVCDHAHLVDCKSAVKLIAHTEEAGSEVSAKVDSSRSSSALSRSFKITPEPSIFLEAPRDSSKKSTTFTMSSTVFLRDSSLKKNGGNAGRIQTAQPLHVTQRSRDTNEFVGNGKSRSLKVEKKFGEGKTTSRPFDFRGNYPYSETLRSMHKMAGARARGASTTARPTTAGTEFPIPIFDIDVSEINGSEEDPYYPKHGTSTEIYYTLAKDKISRPFGFSATERIFTKPVQIKLPDVLPDLNSVNDIVDRRKILYIPKVSSF